MWMKLFCVLLPIVLWQIIKCDSYPEHKMFTSVPSFKKTSENETVILPCDHNGPYYDLKWYRDDQLIAASKRPDFTPPERFQLQKNGSLEVMNVQSDDTGTYICEVYSDWGVWNQTHDIEVNYPASVLSDPSGVVQLGLGAVFEIVCEAKGVPMPIISWRSRNENGEMLPINEETRRYLVNVENKEMAGRIECVADNGVGDPAVAGIYLQVKFAPEVRTAASVVHTKIGFRAVLECIVTSFPAATVHWFHHSAPLKTDFRVTRTDLNMNPNTTVINYVSDVRHILTVKNVRDSDLGMYECRAENKIGVKGAIIELTGRPLPSVFKQSPIASLPRTYNLIWQTESLSPISEYKVKFREVQSGNITPQSRVNHDDWREFTIPSADVSGGPIHSDSYVLQGLKAAGVYEVTIQSRNRYGWSEPSMPVKFATGGELNTQKLSTETVEYEEVEDNFIVEEAPIGNFDYSSTHSSSSAILRKNIVILLLTVAFHVKLTRRRKPF